MQLSLDPNREAHELVIKLTDDKIDGGCMLSCTVSNRAGGVIASMGRKLKGSEVELTPQMLHLMALGWVYLDANAVVDDAKQLLADHRKAYRQGKPF